MRFVFPCRAYEDKAIAFIQEFRTHGSAINGTGSLDRYLKEHSYGEWLLKVMRDLDIANIPDDKVPALTYFYVRGEDDHIVGMINVRLALNDFLRTEGGHIGYSVRPTERNKGYGTRMLREALSFCKSIGLCEIIVTCDKNNIASASVIKRCGGVLDAEFFSDIYQTDVQRYTISVV